MQARVTPVHCEVLMLYHYMANLQREMYILTEASITRVDIHLVVVCVLIYLERERERLTSKRFSDSGSVLSPLQRI